MNIIDATTAERITGDYVKNGNQNHFKFGGKIIKGYQFTRKELTDLFENDTNNEIFIMLALSTDSGMSKYLNIILAKMHDNSMNLSTMIVSKTAPYTSDIIYIADEISIKSSGRGMSKNASLGAGQPIPPEELERIQDAFENATDGHLACTTTDRIKCYRLDRQDFNDLTLDQPVTTTNQDDIFMFMPVIRPKRANDPIPLTKDYLSLAVAYFDPATKKVSGAIIEYCLPCPSACALNYWHR